MKRKSDFAKVLGALGLGPFSLFMGALLLAGIGIMISLVLQKEVALKPAADPPPARQEYREPAAEPTPSPAHVDTKTPFERYSLRIQGTPRPPMVAIIIDDMGENMINSEKILNLPAPLAVAYLTHAPNLQAQIANARAKGKEVLLHVPMEALSDTYGYGGAYLSTGKSASDNIRIFRGMADHLTGFIGINNHMGSKFTASRSHMFSLMEHLNERGLAFVDSLTTPNTPSARLAARIGMKFAIRDVFLDDSSDPAKIAASFDLLETIARRKGYAVAIGHPRPNTIAILSDWISRAQSRGITVVPLSYVITRYGAK